MSSQQLHVTLVSPTRVLLDQPAFHIRLPGKDGYIGLLPGHTALIGELGVGELLIEESSFGGPGAKTFFLAGGYADVKDGRVKILAEIIEPGSEIDRARAARAKERADKRLKESVRDDSIDVQRAELAMKKALYRLKLSDR